MKKAILAGLIAAALLVLAPIIVLLVIALGGIVGVLFPVFGVGFLLVLPGILIGTIIGYKSRKGGES